MKNIYLLCILTAVISGCSIFLGPKPKLYDNAFVVINSDNTLILQQSSDKEFKGLQQSGDKEMMRIIRTRLNEFTEDELASRGDLKVVPACGPRTLKIIQDIESVSVSSLAEFGRKSFTKSDDIHVSISTAVEDCESGKKLVKFSYQNKGQDIIKVVKALASWNVSYAYGYQYGPRPAQ